MFYIWGKNAMPQRMQALLSEEDQKNTCFIDTNPRSWNTMIGESRVVGPEELKKGDADKVLIPLYGVPLEKHIVNSLVKSGISYDKIWIMDEKTWELELRDHKDLSHMISRDAIPYIRILEFEVTHHCNLKCKGCSHFSPLSEKVFGDFDEFSKDLEQIASKIDHVGQIRLMGGEPLLNPDLYKFVEKARQVYPDSEICVVTNGIKLIAIDDRLKETMKKNDAFFSVSLYPPIQEHAKNLVEEMNKEGIKCAVAKVADVFGTRLNPKGDSDKETTMFMCTDTICNIFEKGRISKCSIAHKIPVYEKYFNMEGHFPKCSLDLYDESLSTAKLYELIMGPIDMCAYCGKVKEFAWDRAGKDPKPQDWEGAGRMTKEVM